MSRELVPYGVLPFRAEYSSDGELTAVLYDKSGARIAVVHATATGLRVHSLLPEFAWFRVEADEQERPVMVIDLAQERRAI